MYKVSALMSAILIAIKLYGAYNFSWLVAFAPMLIVGASTIMSISGILTTLAVMIYFTEKPEQFGRFSKVIGEVLDRHNG